MIEEKQYYHPLKDGYDEGDVIKVGEIRYEIIRIEAFNQVMLIEEIE